jgi:hypothetical protein
MTPRAPPLPQGFGSAPGLPPDAMPRLLRLSSVLNSRAAIAAFSCCTASSTACKHAQALLSSSTNVFSLLLNFCI